jgi:hypothetical protein
MMLESKNKSFETFWRNLMRYTVESSPRSVEAATERSFYGTGENVRIRAEVADEKFLKVRDASVSAHVTSPSGQAFDVAMKQTLEGGFEGYVCDFHPQEDGLYRIDVNAKRNGNQSGPLAPAQTSFIVGALNRESRNAAQNLELLKRIAAETGGGYYTASQVNNLMDDITHTEGAGSIRVSYDLWDMPINFLLIIGLAAGEWFVRKRKGLA